jgi:hypothetical protein
LPAFLLAVALVTTYQAFAFTAILPGVPALVSIILPVTAIFFTIFPSFVAPLAALSVGEHHSSVGLRGDWSFGARGDHAPARDAKFLRRS